MVLGKELKYDLSIIIPSRHEEFLNNTIEDILKNKRGKTQIIVGLDGEWPITPIPNHPDVVVLFFPESIGQRALSNRCVRVSDAKYIMKVDAHCAFDEGFDIKMLEKMEDDITMIPVMRNLHVFDWVCKNGHRRYQGPSGPCTVCGEPTEKDIVWIAKKNPASTAYRFDRTMHFQYWPEWGKKQQGELTETMSIQGSCFLVTKDKWWELDISSESFNSWGQQGVEVACKTWLSGGRVLVNRTTWYAHMFRTQGGDFSFPYKNPESKIQENRELSRELFEHNGWGGAKHPFQWLLDKFSPPDWGTSVSKGIVYYTDNKLSTKIARACRNQLRSIGLPIVSASLKPMPWFGKNIHIPLKRGKLTMFKQILAALEASTADIIFFCEHDCLYPKEHFDFIPPRKDVFYYNSNVWRLRASDGHAVYYDHQSTSGLVAYRELLLEEYRKRVKAVEEKGYDRTMGYEPGTRSTRIGGFSDYKHERYQSKVPYIDIRHENNLSASFWSPNDFNRQSSCTNWKESEDYKIEGWEGLKEIF